MVTFLRLNGFEIIVNNEEEHRDVMVAVAEGKIDKQQLANWLRTVTSQTRKDGCAKLLMHAERTAFALRWA
jgi:prophage maintenance system killer protein